MACSGILPRLGAGLLEFYGKWPLEPGQLSISFRKQPVWFPFLPREIKLQAERLYTSGWYMGLPRKFYAGHPSRLVGKDRENGNNKIFLITQGVDLRLLKTSSL